MLIGWTELLDAKTTQFAAVPHALLVTCDADAFASKITSNCWNVAGAISVPVARAGREQSRALLPSKSICTGLERRLGVRSTQPASDGRAVALVLARTSTTVMKMWLYGP